MSLTDIQYVLPAGGAATVPLNEGRYLRLARTTLAGGRLRVKSDKGDDVVLTVGRGVFLDVEAKNAYLENEEASDQTFTLVNGSDSDIDFALAGGLVAIDKTGALDELRFKHTASFAGAARPALQVWNDAAAGSTTRVLVESLRVLSLAGGAILIGSAAELSTLSGLAANKVIGAANLANVQIRREDLAASPGGSQGISIAAANTWYEALGDDDNPWVIEPQTGLTIHINAADTLHVMVEGRQISV